MGQNPPAGAQIFFYLKDVPEELVTFEILDASGEVLRTYATDPKEAGDENYSKLKDLKAGLNRFAWNFRRDSLTKIPDIMVYGSLNGRLVVPGPYRVRLKVGDAPYEQPLEVKPDPRRTATMEDYQEQERFLTSVAGVAEGIHTSVNRLRAIKAQVEALMGRTKEHAQGEAIETAGKALVEKIDEWETQLIQPKQKTFQDVINFENQLGNQVMALIESVDGTEPPVTRGARERLSDLETQWSGHRTAMETLLAEDVASFNTLVKASVDPVIIPEK